MHKQMSFLLLQLQFLLQFIVLASIFGLPIGADAGGGGGSKDYSSLTSILEQGVIDKVYTGAVAIIGRSDGTYYYSGATGSYNYLDENTTSSSPKVTLDTVFDLASVSKVFATTTAVAILYEKGLLNLDDKVSFFLGRDFEVNGKENITIRNCLLHNAGFQPDPSPWFWDPAYGCFQTGQDRPTEDFSCIDNTYKTVLSQSLQQAPGEKYVYSDISFLTLHLVVGSIVYKLDDNNSKGGSNDNNDNNRNLVTFEDLRSECKRALGGDRKYTTDGLPFTCYFEAFVRKYAFSVSTPKAKLFTSTVYDNDNKINIDHSIVGNWLQATRYLPAVKDVGDNYINVDVIPTLNDTGNGSYTHTRLQGRVSDGDCFAMGGMCGHAGIFSTAGDVGKFLSRVLNVRLGLPDLLLDDSSGKGYNSWINQTSMLTFTTEYNKTQSSRALGWTVNDPNVADYGYDNSCGALSPNTFMHTGYSGTCVCVDPDTQVWSVILTNRAYNCQGQLCPAGSSTPVKTVYKNFHNAFMEIYLSK